MARTFTFFSAVSLLGLSLVSACGNDSSNTDQISVLRSDLVAARTEVARHGAACASATSLGGISTELAQHHQQMAEALTALAGEMGGMSHCSGPGMGHMHDLMSSWSGQEASYEGQLGAAQNLDQAHAQCLAYTSAMNQMLDGADADLGDLGCSTMMMHTMM